ncbi:hypothetical protein [Salinarimonas sp.]|uniref:phage head spike fiber domain-containing protein n=1 Tax=Salinarimonas sp. TaxID=2766526 RepID=UPI00391A34FF
MTGYANLPDLISALGGQVIRNTTRWVFNSAGVLVPVAPNQIAFDHDPVTLARRGIPFEPARTNFVRRSDPTSAVPGTPGTLPTGWNTTGGAGLSRQIVGVGTTLGLPWVDVRLFGTTENNSGIQIAFEANTQISASVGATWTASFFAAIAGGSLANINNVNAQINERNTDGSAGASTTTSLLGGLDATMRRFSTSRQITNGPHAVPRLTFGYDAGAAIDVTVRLALPQFTPGAFVTSPIVTTGTALTRDADILVLPLGAWHRLEEYLLFARLTPIANVADGLLMQIWDGASFTTGGGIRLRQGSTPTATAVDQRGAGGVDRGTLVTGNAAAGVLRRIAYRRSAAGAARLVTSSGAAVTGTGVDASPAVSQLRIGGGQAAFHLRGLRFEPVIPTDAAMDALVA